MNLFSRLLGKEPEYRQVEKPDDSKLQEALEKAKERNAKAFDGLEKAVRRQERDAVMVRQVIHDVLKRAGNEMKEGR